MLHDNIYPIRGRYDSVVADPNDPTSLWFYYTYLLPGGTFNERYFVRRSIELQQRQTSFRASRVAFALLRGAARAGGRDGDWYALPILLPTPIVAYTESLPYGPLNH